MVKGGHGRGPAAAVLALATVLALTLVGCTPGGAGAPEPEPTPSSAVEALAAEVAALSPEEQEERLVAEASVLERETLALSGLEEELGGAEAAGEAYDALTAALTEAVRQRTIDPDYAAPFGAGKPRGSAGGERSLGAMMFGSMLMATLAPGDLVTSTNDVKAGEPARDVREDSRDGNSSTMTREASVDSTSMDWTVETTAGGITGKIRVQMTINPCPAPDGSFTATARITASSTSSGGRVGSNYTVAIALNGQIDDDARLVGYEVETTSEAAEFGSGNNVWAESTDRESRTGSTINSYTRTPGRSAGTVPAGFADQWANMSMIVQMMVTPKILEAAQKGWESGRCVALEPTTQPAARSGLEPSTTVTITAAPYSKIDAASTGGTVTGTLSGDTSLDPAGTKVPADATFTYVAPGEVGQSATVALEARSRRGVGKASLTFDTSPQAFDVSGTAPSQPSGIAFTGTICGPDKPFTLATTGDLVGTASFTPTSASAGTFTYDGVVGNAPLTVGGAGTYTLALPEGGAAGTLDGEWEVTIFIPIVGPQTNSGVFTLALTPRAAC